MYVNFLISMKPYKRVYLQFMKDKFSRYVYVIGFLAIIIAFITIFAILTEINNFFTEKIKI